MTTPRELCRVVSAALQVSGVERHAARLVRDGWLPRAGVEIYERDAAILLLGVAATPHPDQASQVIENLASLRLNGLEQAGAGPVPPRGPRSAWAEQHFRR